MEALQWLTPAQARHSVFPRWMLWPAGIALGLCVVGTLAGWTSVLVLGTVTAAVAAVPVAWWFEDRVYGALGDRSAAVKVLTHGLLTLLGVPMFLVAMIALVIPLGLGQFLAVFGGVFIWWVAAASLGTSVVVIIDRVVSAWQTRFPTRLMLAILFLVVAALATALVVSIASSELVARLATDAKEVTVTPFLGMSAAEVRSWLQHHPAALPTGLFMGVFLAALPSVMSACAKLADAAMERLRPMSRAFAMVSQGTRTVRVEEKGSTEFIELAHSFNQLVAALDATERMERAFGRYVSGQVLSKIRAQHGEAELKASLREATVFFADIRGFTTLSERLSPEQVVSFLNRYLARVVAQIDSHLGYLNKFIGDAVVVVFNGPVDQPDHAERAVRCALALQSEVAKLNAEGAMPEVGELKIGIGIATGPMVCGNVGGPTQMEYTVIGDTVNLSARLTSLAGPGEIWVSDATAKGAPGLKFTALPEVKVKGKEKPVTPFRAAAITALAPPAPA